MKMPHPIPYQGSKRNLAPIIGAYVPDEIGAWFEPFAGSAAMSLWMAAHRRPKRIVLGESLEPLALLWIEILKGPEVVARRYAEIWKGQKPGEPDYFNAVRDRFNSGRDPVDLLYLMCRCVKNAVRFNARGQFTQSVDKRRLGMAPAKMEAALAGAATLLQGRTEVRVGDWLETTADAAGRDFIYMDPPYLGTSIGRDRRYAEWMGRERLVDGLGALRRRGLHFALSYDGQCGEKTYGPPLPGQLGLTQLMIHAGTSTQSTLSGRRDQTYESLYLTPGLFALSKASGHAGQGKLSDATDSLAA
jgi:DNA adenine methylase